MDVPAFDPAAFRLLFPAFANPVTYPDAMLDGYYTMASCFITPSCIWACDDCLGTALNLMTAHLLSSTGSAMVAAMGGSGIINSATIDKVSVSRQVPTTKGDFAQFLLQTPFGQQLLALLKIKWSGGIYVGGSPERFAIRQSGGVFGPRFR